MTDVFTPEKRSLVMSKIKGKDTLMEVRVRKHLFKYGFRFRKNVKQLPGKPDIVLPKYHCVIFIHGCFWHGHEGCKNYRLPKTRTEFWDAKITSNKLRDLKVHELLVQSNWRVIVLWECDLEKDFISTMSILMDKIKECD